MSDTADEALAQAIWKATEYADPGQRAAEAAVETARAQGWVPLPEVEKALAAELRRCKGQHVSGILRAADLVASLGEKP